MKLSLIVVVLAACLLTHGVVARASQPQLAGFSDFMTGHQFFDDIADFVEDRVDDAEDAFDDVKDGVSNAWKKTSEALGDGWEWTQSQYDEARGWAKKVNLQDAINKAAKVAIKAAHAGSTAYVTTVAKAASNGLKAAQAFSKGDFKDAAKLAFEAGITLHDAKSNAFKAAVKKGLSGVGLAKVAVFLTRLEKRIKAKATAYAKKHGKNILKK
jgi:Mg-chelatase subunit ChlI